MRRQRLMKLNWYVSRKPVRFDIHILANLLFQIGASVTEVELAQMFECARTRNNKVEFSIAMKETYVPPEPE